MEKPENGLLGLKVGWGKANSVSQVDRVSDVAPTCQLCVGRAQQGTTASASTSVSGKGALSALIEEFSLPHISLMSFVLLPQ